MLLWVFKSQKGGICFKEVSQKEDLCPNIQGCERHTRMWDGVRAGEKASGDQGVVCGWRRMTECGGSMLQNRHGTYMLCWQRV